MVSQSTVKKMVENHVLVNASTMIYNLYANDAYQNELFDLMGKENWIDPAIDAGIEVNEDPDQEGKYYFSDGVEGSDISYDSEEEAYRAACEFYGYEPYMDEVYEHYIVSDWLARKLKEKGEIVKFVDTLGVKVWGRCATGQAIYLDPVMEEIAEESNYT